MDPSASIERRRLLSWLGLTAATGATSAVVGSRLGRAEPPEAVPEPRLAAADREVSARPGGPQPGIGTRIPAFGTVLAIDLAPAIRHRAADARAAAHSLLRDFSRLAEATRVGDQGAAAVGLDVRPASLEVTVGIGSSLLSQCGLDRRRPAGLIELQPFVTDRLDPQLCGGDLLLQIGAEDPMRMAAAVQAASAGLQGRGVVRWSRSGFRETTAAAAAPGQTGRNLMGHRDGTSNPAPGSPLWEATVLAREPSGPADWMDGGSYLVVRQIRIDLDAWFLRPFDQRDTALGRRTSNGAPLTGHDEHDPVALDPTDAAGAPVIAPRAHVRLASTRNTGGARIFRRSWNYDAGWTGTARDAGLLFLAWQADIRRGFLPIQQSLAEGGDLLNTYATHVGSAVFAVPPQPLSGGYVGQEMFET